MKRIISISLEIFYQMDVVSQFLDKEKKKKLISFDGNVQDR